MPLDLTLRLLTATIIFLAAWALSYRLIRHAVAHDWPWPLTTITAGTPVGLAAATTITIIS